MNDSKTKNDFDVIVIGAGMPLFIDSCLIVNMINTINTPNPGISGIIAAQRYLEAHPSCHLAILEKDNCVGGVFSQRKHNHPLKNSLY